MKLRIDLRKSIRNMARKRNRLFTGLWVLFILAGLLAGCGRSTGSGMDSFAGAGNAQNTKNVAAGSRQQKETQERQHNPDDTEIQVFLAASLNRVMAQLAENYNRLHPEVKITCHADSSGTLLTQIQEGYACDIFFSAAQKQMDQLEADGLVVEGTRADAVKNQAAVITAKDSGTKATGLADIGKSQSIALAGGSVPVGRYTRQALMNLDILPQTEDAAAYTAKQVSDALGGVEISEQGNVSKVLLAVIEGSCETGTVYVSDIYGYEKELDILEIVPYELTGDIIYPAAQVKNPDADEEQEKAAAAFLEYILSDEAKPVFEQYNYGVLE